MTTKSVGAFLFLLGLLHSAEVTAQFRVGLLGNLNLANVSVNPNGPGAEWSTRTTYGFGGVLGYDPGKSLGIYFQPMYLQKGTKGTNTLGDEVIAELAYAEIPVLLKYSAGSNDTRPYLIVGPSIGYLLSARAEYSLTGENVNVKDDFKSVDIVFLFGGGVSLQRGETSFFVQGRYAVGVSDINDDPAVPDTSVKSKGIQFLVGVTFAIHRKGH